MEIKWASGAARSTMNYPPPRFSARKKVQLMVIVTILAWATQTLFHQWGYGPALPVAAWSTR